MKISDLIIDDKESIVLGVRLLGINFLKYLLKHHCFGSFSLVQILLKNPDRVHIEDGQLYIPDSWERTNLSYLKCLISQYEDF